MKIFKNNQMCSIMTMLTIFNLIMNDGFPIKTLNNFEEYKNLISNNKLSCIIFYESEKCTECDSTLKKLINDLGISQININFKIDFFLVDISSSNSFKENLFIKDTTFHFYIEQQYLKEMENFKENLEKNFKEENLKNLSKEVENFLTTEIDNFTEELKEIEDFQNLMNEKTLKKFTIYLGDKNINFKTYQESTLQDINYKYYHSFNPDLKNYVEKNFNINFSKNDIVNVITKKTKKNMIKYLEIDEINSSHISRFLSIEKYPKLRGEQYLSNFNKYLFKDKNYILLYIRDNEKKQNFVMYKEIVKKLPKGFIYCHSSLSEDLKLNLNVFFENQGILPEKDSLYILYNMKNNIFINKMQYTMEKKLIISFIKSFVGSFKSILRKIHLNKIVDYFENEDFKIDEL